jgi:FKBP-type peptidyl-prolyl cis-trans isomerase
LKLKTLFAVAAATLLAGCLGDSTGSGTVTIPPPTPLAAGTDTVTTASGLKYAEITVGTGTLAQNGSNVQVHYTGWLLDGTGFDTSLGGSAIPFTIGSGALIKGFEEGVIGMRVGGKRRVILPPDLAYGSNTLTDRNGNVVIPPNSTIIFDITLVAVAN